MLRFVWSALLILCLSNAAYGLTPEEREKAKQFFLSGNKAFDLGRYDEAVQAYASAYAIKDDAALLYNIAQAHRLAAHNEDALRYYKVYLARAPDARNRAEVEGKIAILQRAIEDAKKAQQREPDHTLTPGQPPPAPPPAPVLAAPAPAPAAEVVEAPSPGRGRTLKISGLAIAGVGLASLGAGIAFGVLAKQSSDSLTRTAQAGGEFSPSAASSGALDQVLEGVFLGIGGAAVATGVVLYAIGVRRSHHWSLKQATVSPTGAFASVGRNF